MFFLTSVQFLWVIKVKFGTFFLIIYFIHYVKKIGSQWIRNSGEAKNLFLINKFLLTNFWHLYLNVQISTHIQSHKNNCSYAKDTVKFIFHSHAISHENQNISCLATFGHEKARWTLVKLLLNLTRATRELTECEAQIFLLKTKSDSHIHIELPRKCVSQFQ